MAIASSNVFPKVIIGGLTGAVTQTRLVGANASGAPTTGTFVAGDIAGDLTGKLWMCTTGGTPGTWTALGGGGAMSQIAAVSASGGSQATIHFASVPGTYNHLLLLTSLRTTSGNNLDISGMQFNSDTAGNYQWSGYEGNASANPAADGANADTSLGQGRIAGGIAPASSFSGGFTWIFDYANTHKHKFYRAADGLPYDATHVYTQDFAGKWLSTTAITDILLTPGAGSFAQYSTAILYGVN